MSSTAPDGSSPANGEVNIGSLLRLFKSSFFNTFFAVSYLSRYRDQPGVIDYLGNALYSLPDRDIEFYLPQLCNLLLCTEPADVRGVETFLLDKCASSMHFALKVFWILQGAIGDGCSGNGDRAVHLLQHVEMAAVNRERPGAPRRSLHKELENASGSEIPTVSPVGSPEVIEGSRGIDVGAVKSQPMAIRTPPRPTSHMSSRKTITPSPIANRDMYERFFVKKFTADFFNAVVDMMRLLSEVSDHLATLPDADRLPKLKQDICALNKALPKHLYLPLGHADTQFHRILCIAEDDVAVLQSRDRAPCLLHVEVEERKGLCSTFNMHQIALDEWKEKGAKEDMQEVLAQFNAFNCNDDDDEMRALNLLSSPPGSPPCVSPPASPLRKMLHDHHVELKRGTSASPTSTRPVTGADSDSDSDSNDDLPVEPVVSPPYSPAPHNLHGRGIVSVDVHLDKEEENNGVLEHVNAVDKNERDGEDWIVLEESVCSPAAFQELVFGESFAEKCEARRKQSPYGKRPHWKYLSFIVKSGDDVRQEHLAAQIITQFKSIWEQAKIPLWLYSVNVLSLSSTSGLIETIPDAISMHTVKKRTPNFTTLKDFFVKMYGHPESEEYERAQHNFMGSLAAYSLVTYFLRVKDRHNGNILLDRQGHIIHIDFGFMLSNSPGSINFEKAPFKLLGEFVEIMDGEGSDSFNFFKVLVVRGFLEARKHYDKIMLLIEVMMENSTLPCFSYDNEASLEELRDRFKMGLTEAECVEYVEQLVLESLNNWRTTSYDRFQLYSNGIL